MRKTGLTIVVITYTNLKSALEPTDFVEDITNYSYHIWYSKDAQGVFFNIKKAWTSTEKGIELVGYEIERRPGDKVRPDMTVKSVIAEWGHPHYIGCVVDTFNEWADAVACEIEAPDLWAEATKAVQLFAPAADLAADKFTIAELGAVHGQLRMLKQLFEASELLCDCWGELIELTQTAAVKAEAFTKKDWQNWMKGAFGSCVASLKLSEAQAQELLALVRLAFGGLFLHQ